MFKICTSVESWTDADLRNIAVIHCLTGKGRTAVIVACVLTWIGMQAVSRPYCDIFLLINTEY